MHAHARLAVATDRGGDSRIARLRSDPPLVLRPTHAAVPTAALRHWVRPGAVRVSLATAAAGPLGGDLLRLDVDVAVGATLVLDSVTASLVLPGPRGGSSRTEITVRVATGGTLCWLPEPVIAVRDCDHRAVTRIHLEPGARLLAREQLLLGRHGESPGTIRQRLRVTLGGRALHDQELAIGQDAKGWSGAAVTGGRTALGSLLAVDPDREATTHDYHPDARTAVLRLDDSATLVTVLAHDALALRRLLDAHSARSQPQNRLPGSSPPAGDLVRDDRDSAR